MSRLAVALKEAARDISKGLFWIAVAIVIAKVFFDNPSTTQQTAKALPPAPLDLNKPVYTKANAILCPMSLFFVPNADMKAVVGLWTTIWDRSEKVKAVGCQQWTDGIRVKARKLFQDDDEAISIEGTFFTMRSDLRN